MFRIYLYVLLATAFTAGAAAETHTIVVGGPTATFEDTTVCGNLVDGEPGEWIYGAWTNHGGNTVQDECPVACSGDLLVDTYDFSAFLINFGNDCNAPLRSGPLNSKRKQKQTH